MLADPHGVEAEILDGADHVKELRPADVSLDLRELDTDLERADHGPQATGDASNAARIARRWSGELPQQPPMIRAPESRISRAVSDINAGLAR
jgi:hypothetical protein